jgi:hypothetical protein
LKAAPEGVAMTLPRRIVRPDYEGEPRAIWIDPDHIASDKKLELEKLLPRRMATAQRSEFMKGVANAVQWASFLQHQDTIGRQKDQIQTAAEKARALLQSIAKIQPSAWRTLRGFGNEFLVNEICPASISEHCENAIREGEMLPIFWDVVQDIETVFQHVADQLKADKQDRPAINNPKNLICEVAEEYFKATGNWPPYSKGRWFVDFAKSIGQLMGMDIGLDIVGAAVKEQKSRV